MSSKVLLLRSDKLNAEGLKGLFNALDIGFIAQGSFTAIKIHFGETGNNAWLKPEMVKPIIDKVKGYGANAFLTDANTIYKGSRSDAVNHLNTAYSHGYSPEKIGIPVIISDGLTGKDFVDTPVKLKHFKTVKLSSAAVHADSIITLTHFKGHELTGFGGSLKNIGMGLGSRSGKQMMHSDVKPEPDKKACIGCGTCVKWCPTLAITLVDGKAVIERSKCIGCGECVASCRYGAIIVSWAGTPDSVQEKIVEYFYGIWKDKRDKMAFFNYIIDVSPNCDCYGWNDAPVVDNIGVLASFDPVAIDQASIDLVNKAEWSKGSTTRSMEMDKFRAVYPDIDWSVQLKYAEKLGIGSRKYDLIKR